MLFDNWEVNLKPLINTKEVNIYWIIKFVPIINNGNSFRSRF